MINTILVDMDGVLADFARHALPLFDRMDVYDTWPEGKYEIEDIIGVPQDEFWLRLDAEGPEFWATMPALPWAEELCKIVRDTSRFYISTSPSRAPASSMGKVHWMQDFFDPRFRRYMLGSHKYLMAKPGVVLIDESDAKCVEFRQYEGHAILFPQPWNKNYTLIDSSKPHGGRMEYVRAELLRHKRGRLWTHT
jgi:5'(3')-deoxyribonucleotidase